MVIDLSARRVALYVWSLALLAWHSPSYADDFFLGEVELQINGELVKHSQVWRCTEQVIFRPSDFSLFKRAMRQDPVPASSFVIKTFGSGEIAVFENWTGCPGKRANKEFPFGVDILNSLESPTYGEHLYLQVGAVETVHNPFDSRFRVRLLKDDVRKVDLSVFKAHESKSAGEQLKLQYRLRQTAAHQLVVDMLTWKVNGGRIGFRESLPLNKGVWEVAKRNPPAVDLFAGTVNAGHFYNSSFILFPLAERRPRVDELGLIQIKYGDRSIALDPRGYAQVEGPEPEIARVRFYAQIRETIWASQCAPGILKPECPNTPVGPR